MWLRHHLEYLRVTLEYLDFRPMSIPNFSCLLLYMLEGSSNSLSLWVLTTRVGNLD